MGKTVYLSGKEVIFPIVMKTDKDDFVKREVVANVIYSEEVNFLCGKETIKEWKTNVYFEDDKIEFKEQECRIDGFRRLSSLSIIRNGWNMER